MYVKSKLHFPGMQMNCNYDKRQQLTGCEQLKENCPNSGTPFVLPRLRNYNNGQ